MLCRIILYHVSYHVIFLFRDEKSSTFFDCVNRYDFPFLHAQEQEAVTVSREVHEHSLTFHLFAQLLLV